MLKSAEQSKAVVAVLKATSHLAEEDWADKIKHELTKTGGGLVGLLCRRAKNRAAEMKREFALDYDSVSMALIACNGKCSVTGMPLSFSGNSYDKPSIDRIDSTRGYSLDNIRITSVIANLAMNTWGETPLHIMCGYLAQKTLLKI